MRVPLVARVPRVGYQWSIISGDGWGLSFPDICLTVEQILGKTSTRKTDPTGVDSGGPEVIVLATGSEVREFKPGRGRWIFQSVKILSMSTFEREVKPWVPCRRFTARKRTSSRNKSL